MAPPTWQQPRILRGYSHLLSYQKPSPTGVSSGNLYQSMHAPWFGGFWERLIGLTKSSLRKTLRRTHATIESLQTIVVEVEALLNDHPLAYSSSDIGDPEPITLSHLLRGRRITTLPHTRIEDDEVKDPDLGNMSEVTHRARVHAIITKHFWSR